MQPPIPASSFALLMFCGMLVLLEVGYRLGRRRRWKETDTDRSSLSAVEGAVFALLGLLMAFTFSGAAARFNEKRALVGEEANAIETAYLRLQILPWEAQSELKELFRKYLDSRLATYRKLPDMQASQTEMAESKKLQLEIWGRAISAIALPDARPSAGFLLPPALNNMIDISTTRTVALYIHPPAIIYALLLGVSLISALLMGYRIGGAQRRSWIHILGFTTMTVIVAYVTLDIEYPRTGLFRLNDADAFLIQVRQHMK
jgi:hypothetical protein